MKSTHSLRFMLEVDFLQDGGMAWRVCKPDKRKKHSHKKWICAFHGLLKSEALLTSEEIRQIKRAIPDGLVALVPILDRMQYIEETLELRRLSYVNTLIASLFPKKGI